MEPSARPNIARKYLGIALWVIVCTVPLLAMYLFVSKMLFGPSRNMFVGLAALGGGCYGFYLLCTTAIALFKKRGARKNVDA